MIDTETGLDFLNKDHQPILERHLIGCCIADSFACDEAAAVVEAEDFAIPEYAELFRACLQLRAEGRNVTSADLFEYLVRTRRSGFPCFGGNAAYWLWETAELEPIGSRARYYATYIRDAALLRQLRGAATDILDSAMRPYGPASEMLGTAEAKLFALSNAAGPRKENLASAKELLRDSLQRIDVRRESGGKMLGIPSGYLDLDKLLAGFRPGQMVVIGARPSVGKTALALNIASRVANEGVPVLFFSVEMPNVEIADRLLAIGSGVPMHSILTTKFDEGDIPKMTAVASPRGIGGSDLFVDDCSNQTVNRMLQITRRAIRKFGIALVIVDYLQLIQPENTRLNRNEQVGALARGVKGIARECGVPVVCLAQLNREVESRSGEPRLSDLRDSGEIEQHADAVILLHRDGTQEPNDPGWSIDTIVAKNRNGPTGKARLLFLRALMRFENHCHGW